ncbi:MAG: hypothetical protein HY868_17675 [Chloroflexi bacterium]|nr:hypothetical protein [Chloroflexota bacterium]
MKVTGWFLGCGTTFTMLICLAGISIIAGGAPFNPGPLSAQNLQNRPPLAGFASHADFEPRCDLCHAPFRGADATRCVECHTTVRDQLSAASGLHGTLRDSQNCTACHSDHKGRDANLTNASIADFSHNQFGFTLARHQRDYSGAAMNCRACHPFSTQANRPDAQAVSASCVDCHQLAAATFIASHRREVGDACLACHDGADRMKGFNHATVFALTGKHTQVACGKCHVNNRFRDTPRDCARCHPDPQVHRGQFGNDCAACHTTAAWRPARLIKHTFPLIHGNKGKESACAVCHPKNYATYTCYGCHEHTQAEITRAHQKERIADLQNCVKCHPTGRE